MQRRQAIQAIASVATLGAGTLVNAAGLDTPSGLKPDPNTKTPSYKAPPGACDAHCHIFGPAARYPYSPKRSYTPFDAGLDDFKKVHAVMGMERAVIVNASLYDTDARVVLDAMAQSAGRYRTVLNVDDSVSDAELAALHRAGARGCRFNFVKHLGGFPDMAVFDRTMRRIAKLGWHVDLHFDAKDLPDFYDLLKNLPVPYLIDHMGRVQAKNGLEQQPFKVLVDLLRRDPKCHVKICGADRVSNTGAPFLDAVPFAQRLVENASERILWGSDWPHPNVQTMPNDGDLVNLIPLFAPAAATQKQILVDNPQRLYQFDD